MLQEIYEIKMKKRRRSPSPKKMSPKKSSPKTTTLQIGKGRGATPFPIVTKVENKNPYESLYNQITKLLNQYK